MAYVRQLAATAAVVLAAAACSSSGTTSSTGATSSPHGGTVKVAVIGPMTGPAWPGPGPRTPP